jgi:two-component system nitrate/nitrite response regulator NarL
MPQDRMFLVAAASSYGPSCDRAGRKGTLRPTRLFLVADEGLSVHAICLGVEPYRNLEIVGHANSGSVALAGVMETRPDVILLDAETSGVDGLELLDQLRTRRPESKVVMLSAVEDAAISAEAFRRGATAILGKGIDPADVAPLIGRVAEGRPLALNLAEAGSATGKRAALTDREREILEQVAAGHSNKQIAWRLSLSERTVKYYLTHVYRKLGVKGRAEAAEHRIARSLAFHRLRQRK